MDENQNQTEENTAAEGTSIPEGSVKGAASPMLPGLGGVLGVKTGMTQVYDESGKALAVTVVKIKDNTITQMKRSEKHGYTGVQVGFLPKKASRTNKPELGHYKKAGLEGGVYHAQEFRVADDASVEGFAEGQILSVGFLKDGDLVDVSAVSKGKGFQGVMKRHNFRGGPASHGASVSHRSLGSIGNRADPGKVYKGRKMSGHMGHKKVSIQNIQVVKVDVENGVLLLNGSVPGPKSGIVTIQKAVKAGN